MVFGLLRTVIFLTFRIRRAKLYQIAAFRGLKTPVLKRQVGNERVKRPNRENNNNGRSPSPQPTCEVHVRALPLLGTTHRYSLGMRRLPMCLCFTIKGMTSVPRGTVGRRARAFLPPSPLPLPMSVCRRMERESPIFLLFCDQHFFPNRSSFMSTLLHFETISHSLSKQNALRPRRTFPLPPLPLVNDSSTLFTERPIRTSRLV